MDKQQSDHIENRFRQAADNFLPPQHEEAWKRMEALLDKDPDRRKPFIWWWMLALLLIGAGGIGTYYYSHNSSKEKQVIVGAQTDRISSGKSRNGKASRPAPVITGIPKNQAADGGKDVVQLPKEEPVFVTDTQTGGKEFGINRKDALIAKPVARQRNQVDTYTTVRNLSERKGHPIKRNKKDRLETNDGSETTVLQNSLETTDPAAATVLAQYQQPAYVVEVDISNFLLKHPDSQVVLQDSLQTAVKEAISKAAEQSPQPAKFYFIVSAGKNATSLLKFDTKNVGKVFGGEIGYHLNSIFSIQAGFHAGRKIYVAGPKDYKAKPGSYWDNPSVKIIKVDADCYIFELPLSVRADLLQTRHRTLYATAGISSFITNKEDYKYHFNYTSMYRMYAANYKGNVDWFSSAHFSIGVEQRLFKKIYLQAEPYAILPLSGIGEGRVKLYSLGIQLGLKYQPQKQK